MWLTSVLDYLKSTSLRTQARRVRREGRSKKPVETRLILEALEDRCLLSFSPAVIYPVGASPQAVVTGDFNGDGRLDLAVANQSSNTVSVLLGKGDGTFQPARDSATGASPNSLAVGDFNGDGKLDILTDNYQNMTVSVLLGNGDGTFQAARNYSVLSNPRAVAVGDFNGDGKLDIVTDTANYTVNVLLGNGDGTFQAARSTAVMGGPPLAVAVGDFNKDGKLDLAVTTGSVSYGATYGTGYYGVISGPGNPAAVQVLLGNGDGAFTAGNSYVLPDNPNSVAVADLNGDGKLDIVTANETANASVSVLLGNGDGTFGSPTSFGPYYNESVAVADVNRDGKLDIVTESTYGNGTISVFLNNGHGGFGAAQTFSVGSAPSNRAMAAGDFNGDGFSDLAVTNNNFNTVSVLLNAADWSTPPAQAGSFTVSGFLSPTTAGAAGSFTVTAKNTDGTTVTGYTGTVHFTSSDGQAVLPAVYTFTAADGGVHTFSATLETAGAQSLTATDTLTASLTGSETGITVKPAAASHLGVSAPASSTAGTAFSVTVTALDPYNNTATGYTGAVRFTSSDGQAILPSNYTFTAADNGVHTFSSGVILKAAGTQTVTASDTVASAITGSAPMTINAAAASTMTVTGFPSPITAGVAGIFTVTLKDLYGNIASGYTGTVHFTSSDGNAALPANYTFTAADAGVHTFSVILKTAGAQSLTVADTTTASLTGTDGGITVNAAAASQFIISAPSTVTSGVAFSLTITVEDAYGNVVTGYTGTIHFTSSDRTATLPADYTFTAADKGVYTFSGLVLRKRGTQKITITDTLNSSLIGSVIENVL